MEKKWWQEAVVYEIYCKSFCDSNGDGIGDLPGVMSKLPMLKELGVNCIWFAPIYTSPQIDNGYDVVYESAQKIFSDFEAERFGRVPAGEDRTSRYMECDLLIIDDLGTEMQTQFTVPCLYNLINSRLISEKSMIISTNVRKEELLTKYSDRITSRLFGEFEICVFAGKDIRSQKLMRRR